MTEGQAQAPEARARMTLCFATEGAVGTSVCPPRSLLSFGLLPELTQVWVSLGV